MTQTLTHSSISARFMPRKSERKQKKLRLAIDGPSGSGKTYTALEFAFVLSPNRKVCVIDTEYRSASLYSGQNGWEFDEITLDSFSPSNYVEAINTVGHLGYEVCIIDSLSHAWEGKDGALEQVDKKKSQSSNSFTAWKDVSPQHRAMVEAILQSPCHVIATMRTKTEYVLEQDEKGKMKPAKIGMKPIQRDGVEYEFDVTIDIDLEHVAKVSKTRCSLIDGKIWMKPSGAVFLPVVDWLTSGATVEVAKPTLTAWISDEQKTKLLILANQVGLTTEKVNAGLSRYGCSSVSDLTAEQAKQEIALLESKLKAMDQRAKADAIKQAQSSPVVNHEQNGNGSIRQHQAVVGQVANDNLILPEQIDGINAVMAEFQKLPEWNTPKLPANCLEASIKKRGFDDLRSMSRAGAQALLDNMRGLLIKLAPPAKPIESQIANQSQPQEPGKEVSTKTTSPNLPS